MILPGISGSLILLILGMYEAVVAAVNDRRIAMLLIFIGGAVVGLALFSPTLLNRLLRDHHRDDDGSPCRPHGGLVTQAVAVAAWDRIPPRCPLPGT